MGADISQFVGKAVFLQNDHGQYLNCQGASFHHSKTMGAWEQWILEPALSTNGKISHVYLNNVGHDIRLMAQDNRQWIVPSKNRSDWERWEFSSVGDRFFIKSHFGTYLNQGMDGRVIQSPNRGGSECFRVIPVSTYAPVPQPTAYIQPAAPIVVQPTVIVPHVEGVVHMSGVGDVSFRNSQFGGSKGHSRALEGFSLNLRPRQHDLGLEYSCHAANIGDMSWTSTGGFMGSRGQSRRIEGITVRLTGSGASRYILKYTVHMAGRGDSHVCTSGQYCGTKGESRAIEGIKVWLEAAPVAYVVPQPTAYIQPVATPTYVPVPVPVAMPTPIAPVYPAAQPVTGTTYPGYVTPGYPAAPTPSYAPAAPGGIVTSTPRGRFYLTSAHKTQLSASNTGGLLASPNRAGWEVITISDAGNGRVLLTTAHNTQVQCSDYGAIATSPNRNTWEWWTIQPTGNGKWYFISHTGNHLGMADNGAIYCSNRNTGPWEQWELSTA